MNCKVTEEHLNLFLDGELVPTDAERVSTHLRDCDRCSDYLESIARVRDLLRGLPRERAADGFSEAVGKRISATQADTDRAARKAETIIYPGRLRRFTPVLAAACVLFIACAFAILYLVGNGEQAPDFRTAEGVRSAREIAAADSLENDLAGSSAGRKAGDPNDRVELDIETDNLAEFEREFSLYLASLNAEEIKAGPVATGGGAGNRFGSEGDLARPEESETRLRGDTGVVPGVAEPEKPAHPGKADSKSWDTAKKSPEVPEKLQFEADGGDNAEDARREKEARAVIQGINEELAVDGELKGFAEANKDGPLGADRLPEGFGELRSTLAAAVAGGAEVKYSRITCGDENLMIAGSSGEAKEDELKKPADNAPSDTGEKALDKTLEIAESIEKDAAEPKGEPSTEDLEEAETLDREDDKPESEDLAEGPEEADGDNKAEVGSRTGKRGDPGGKPAPRAEDVTEGEADAGEEREPSADREDFRKEGREIKERAENEEDLPRPLERGLKKKQSLDSVRTPLVVIYTIVVGDRTFIITVCEKVPEEPPAEAESE